MTNIFIYMIMDCCKDYLANLRYNYCPICGKKIELNFNERKIKYESKIIYDLKKHFSHHLLFTLNLFKIKKEHSTELTYDIVKQLCSNNGFFQYKIKDFEEYKSYKFEENSKLFNKVCFFYEKKIIINVTNIYYIIKHECINAYIEKFEILDENEYLKSEKSKIKYFTKWYNSFNNNKFFSENLYIIFENAIFKSYFNPNFENIGELKEEYIVDYLEYQNIPIKKIKT
jgi:hypothetical protein